MTKEFQPTFKNFQEDIEGFLTSIGKRERTKDGLVLFRGYFDALKMMYRKYLEHGAFEPLVAHFKKWNW